MCKHINIFVCMSANFGLVRFFYPGHRRCRRGLYHVGCKRLLVRVVPQAHNAPEKPW